MTTTPTVWKAQSLLNAPGTFGDVVQEHVSLVDIGQGRHVAVWLEGGDYSGQIFDAEGGRSGGIFVVNVTSSAGTGAGPLALASRTDGGFVAAYALQGGTEGVFYDVYDAAGTRIDGGTIQALDTPNLTNPSIAMQADGAFLVTFVRENVDNTFDVVGRRVDANGTVGSELAIHDSGDTSETFAEAATLANGNYVVVYQNEVGAGDNDIDFKIFGKTSSPPAGQGFQATPISIADDIDPQVAALTGGGFVIVWESGDASGRGINARVYTFDGGGQPVPGAIITVNTTTTGNQTAPDVVALKDGGFLVTWDDAPSGSIRGQRYDATGTKIGTEFLGSPKNSIVVSNDSSDRPATALLGDGRVVIGYDLLVNGVIENFLEVSAAIFDPREKTIDGTGGNDVLTSRLDGATVNGLGGGDTLLGQAGDDTLDGGSGLDTMKGRGGNDTYIVDNVGDFPVENSGEGNDSVISSVSYSLVDHVENLTLTGSAASGGGNGSANVITGHGGSNRLDGFDGNDTLLGKGGGDFLYGGNDDDRVSGGEGVDELTGGAGRDSFVFDAAVNSKSVAAANADTIADFSPVDDTIELAASMFPKLKAGVLTAKSFDSGKKKPAKDKHLVYYDEKKGGLWYDANGKTQKGKGDVLIATLDKGLVLTAADILVA